MPRAETAKSVTFIVLVVLINVVHWLQHILSLDVSRNLARTKRGAYIANVWLPAPSGELSLYTAGGGSPQTRGERIVVSRAAAI